jgi:fumarate reductase flavoprotein subunit
LKQKPLSSVQAVPELIKEETGLAFGKDLFSFAIGGITGDGLKMA